MRNFFLFVFFVSAFNGSAQTWVYHPMPDSSASWNIEAVYSCPTTVDNHQHFSITITGDTLIGGQVYHKLFTPYVDQSFSVEGCGSFFSGYKGAIRQDTSLKAAYIVQPADSLEELLYDFDMQVGDTLKGVIASVSPDTVVSIDSVLVGGNYRKRWNITYGIYFIEGLGSSWGLVQYSTTGVIGYFGDFWLTCFAQDGSSLFPGTATNCELISSIDSPGMTAPQIRVFPNPAEGLFFLDDKEGVLQGSTCSRSD
jgi:hypothetical protein